MSEIKVGDRIIWDGQKGQVLCVYGDGAFVIFDKDRQIKQACSVLLMECRKLVKKPYVPKVGDRVKHIASKHTYVVVNVGKNYLLANYVDEYNITIGISAPFDSFKKLRKKKVEFRVGDRIKDKTTKRKGTVSSVMPFEYKPDGMPGVVIYKITGSLDNYVKLRKKIYEPKFKIGEAVKINHKGHNYHDWSFLIKGIRENNSKFNNQPVYILNEQISIEENYLIRFTPNLVEKKELKLEVGKFYRTRDGRKACCYNTVGYEFQFVTMDIFDTYHDGSFFPVGKSESNYDIIAEWED